jgi:hypothetical protein
MIFSKIQAHGLESLEIFRNQFNSSKLVKGTEIFFRNKHHTLVTYINKKEQQSIECHSLCSALFDIFLGANPISERAKEVSWSFLYTC